MKYWAYVNNEILGPFEKEKLLELPSFSPSLLVCPQTPVGEKTEDWKETSTYPELSTLLGGGKAAAPSFQKSFTPTPIANEAPAAESPKPNLIGITSLGFKPLQASQKVEPVPPLGHGGMTDITVNRLGKAGAEPPASQPHQASSSFDPISLSHIERRSETLSGEELPAAAQPNMGSPAAAAEGISLEPQRAFPQPAAASEAAAPSFAPAASGAPIIENFSRPAAAMSPHAVTDVAGLEGLIQRLDAIARTAATRQDVNSAVDPLRIKLDQMGEVISSMKNSEFQHEVMGKLVYLENAVVELKTSFRAPQPAKGQKVELEKNSDSVFGAPAKAEKPNPFTSGIAKAPTLQASKLTAAEPAMPVEIADTGSKPSRILPLLKKAGKLVFTLVLLTAVALMAVIGLKNFRIFDATKFIPFQLPFAGGKEAQEPVTEPEQKPAEQPLEQKPAEQPAAGQKPEQAQTAPVQDQKKALPPEVAPEIIYITRTFKLKPAGQSLENKLDAHSAKAGGSYSGVKWEVRPAEEGMFEIDAVIPAKPANLTYSFKVDRAKKAVSPANEPGKAVFNTLAGEAAQKPSGKKAAKQKAAAKPAAKQPKKAAGKKKASPEEEYEYEYVEDDGTEQ